MTKHLLSICLACVESVDVSDQVLRMIQDCILSRKVTKELSHNLFNEILLCTFKIEISYHNDYNMDPLRW